MARRTLVASLVMLAVLLSTTGFAGRDPLFVAPGATGAACTAADPCGSIQQAVDLAEAGDLIMVRAGTYTENITVPVAKEGLTIQGEGSARMGIQSAGGTPDVQAPAGVPADIVIDIFAPGVTVRNLAVRHPAAMPSKRDLGVFVRPPALDVTLQHMVFERLRTGAHLEPTNPGSRGVIVLQATGMTIKSNLFQGNYEDHIHLPTSEAQVLNNEVNGATRLGIVVIQETPGSLNVDNVIQANTVTGSGGDGIQIQGDRNLVQANRIFDNGGYGIHLCGPNAAPACVPPGSASVAENNVVVANQPRGNALGAFIDGGANNTVVQPAVGD